MEGPSSEELEAIRESVREFAEKEVRPLARRIDEENEIPGELLRKGSEMGYFSLRVPEEYGGPGLGLLESVVVIEELSRASSGYGLVSVVSGSMVVYPLARYASEEVREKYLSLLAKGGIGAFALTEPCCGSDAAAIETRAVRDGDEYVVRGQKIFITNSTYADFFIVAARTGRQEDRHRGVSLFVVDRSGCVKVSKLDMMGYRGSGTGLVYFDECRVPRENLIGGEGEGFKMVMMTLNEGRISTSASGLGVARAAFEEALRYSMERRSMGKPLIEHQMVQSMIAEMATKLEASRLLIYEAARRADVGDPRHILLASMAKLYTATAIVDVARTAMQVLGGIGYSRESEVERYYRDVKMIEIGDGTNEVQKMVIVKYLQGRIKPY